MGWHATIFYGRRRLEQGESENWRRPPAEWPVFDFALFATYLQRGVWPFLVALVGGLVMAPVMLLCLLPVFLTVAIANDNDANGAVVALAVLFSVALILVLAVVANVLLLPFTLRGYALQDFKAAFSFSWARDFLRRNWKDIALVILFSIPVGLILALGGYVMVFIGVYFTISLAIFSSSHLTRQLLDLHVQRGGEALAPAPSLLDQPPSPLAPAIAFRRATALRRRQRPPPSRLPTRGMRSEVGC